MLEIIICSLLFKYPPTDIRTIITAAIKWGKYISGNSAVKYVVFVTLIVYTVPFSDVKFTYTFSELIGKYIVLFFAKYGLV